MKISLTGPGSLSLSPNISSKFLGVSYCFYRNQDVFLVLGTIIFIIGYIFENKFDFETSILLCKGNFDLDVSLVEPQQPSDSTYA